MVTPRHSWVPNSRYTGASTSSGAHRRADADMRRFVAEA